MPLTTAQQRVVCQLYALVQRGVPLSPRVARRLVRALAAYPEPEPDATIQHAKSVVLSAAIQVQSPDRVSDVFR